MAMRGSHGGNVEAQEFESASPSRGPHYPQIMEEPGTAIIGTHCKRCLDAFHNLCEDLGSSVLNYTNQIKLPAVEDEYGRFKIWAGNIGAHRSGRVSLDHRLREAPRTRERLINLLGDLENNLNDGQ